MYLRNKPTKNLLLKISGNCLKTALKHIMGSTLKDKTA